MAIMVENKNGAMVDFEVAVEFMDDVIREGIANDGTSYSEQGFFYRLRKSSFYNLWRK